MSDQPINKHSYLRSRKKRIRPNNRFSSKIKSLFKEQNDEKSNSVKLLKDSPTKVLRTSDIIKHYKTLDLDKYTEENKGFFKKAKESLYDPNNEVMFAIIARLNYNKMVYEIENQYEY
jgi:hypothetical protein